MTRVFALVCAALITWVNFAIAAPKVKKPEPKQEQAAAPVCAPLAPLMDRLIVSGLEYEVVTERLAVLKITAVLKEGADKPFPAPTSLVIAFVGEEAAIGIIVGDKLCSVLRGPAEPVRKLLRQVHGQSVSAL